MKHKEFRVRIPWPSLRVSPSSISAWLPSRGNVIFTLLMIGLLLWVQTAGAVPLGLSNAATNASIGTIAYQGRLADAAGNPLTDTVNMIFRLYDVTAGGAPLWEEQWTGSNAVQVSDGLFNVMLGSLTPIPQSVISGNSTLWLGITVGTDDEMAPRVQLGTVPFAVQAQSLTENALIPMVPRILAYVNKQNDLLFDSAPDGSPRVVETIEFTLPQPLAGYRWDLEWQFNQRFGAMTSQSVGTNFLLDGLPIKDDTGTAFRENTSLSIQHSPIDNMIFGGTVYQNNVAAGNHVLTWRTGAYGDPSDKFLVRQRWLVLTAILVPESF